MQAASECEKSDGKSAFAAAFGCKQELKILFQCPCDRIVINNKQEVVHI